MADKSVRASCWSVTINNPTEVDELEIQACRATRGWSVEGQKEVGENGTPHYQLMVKSSQVRFAAVKKMFSRGHIEVARAPKKLAIYVHKEDTRVAELPAQSQLYPNQSTFWDMCYDKCLSYNVLDLSMINGGTFIWFKEFDRKFANDAMKLFDNIVYDLIMEGYYVESMGVNPQVRGAWQRYHQALLCRSRDARESRARRNLTAPNPLDETDRQTTGAFDLQQTISVPVTNNEDASSQSGTSSSGSSSPSSDGTQDALEGYPPAGPVL